MADGRSQTSSDNGKKGGRPVSQATVRTQAARDYISQQMQASLAPIVAKAITQAMEGNGDARDWLSSYSWGKPQQSIDLTSEGQANLDEETLIKAREAIGAVISADNS
jgi:hypothetical protein